MRSVAKFVIIIIFLLWGLPFLPVQANTNLIFINVDAKAEDDGMNLQIYFKIPNYQEQVRLNPKGNLQIINSPNNSNQLSAESEVREPDSPIRIVLLLDASGSMAGNLNNLKDAAKKAVDEAPARAEIAVFRFSYVPLAGGFPPIQDFTADRQLAKGAIDSIQASGGTCLYNATYQVTDYITKIAPNRQDRRAVIVFTDGKNEACDSNSSPIVDGNRSVDAVVARAKLSSITPLYTIGLCSTSQCNNVDKPVLERIAKETLGTSNFYNVNDLAQAFNEIMIELKNQWVANVKIRAHAGKNEAVLRIPTADNSNTLTGIFSFDSPRDFNTLPKIELAKEVAYDSRKDRYILDLKLLFPESLSRLDADILLSNRNTQVLVRTDVLTEIGKTPDGNTQYAVAADNFKAGQEYCFNIKAYDKNDQPIRTDRGETVLINKCLPQYDPQAALPKIEFVNVQYDSDKDQYGLDLKVSRPDIVGSLAAKVLEGKDINSQTLVGTETRLAVNETRADATDTSLKHVVSAASFKANQVYCFELKALDKKGQVIERDGANNTKLITTVSKCIAPYNPLLALPEIELLKTVNYDKEKDQYLLDIKVKRPEMVGHINIEVLQGNDSNASSLEIQTQASLPPPLPGEKEVKVTYNISTEKFKIDQAHCFNIVPVDKRGQLFRRESDKTGAPVSPAVNVCASKYDPVSYAIQEIKPDSNLSRARVSLGEVKGTAKRSLMIAGEIKEGDTVVEKIGNLKPDNIQSFDIILPEAFRQANVQKTYTLVLWLQEGNDRYKQVTRTFTVNPLAQFNWLLMLLIMVGILAMLGGGLFYYRRLKSPKAVAVSPYNQEHEADTNEVIAAPPSTPVLPANAGSELSAPGTNNADKTIFHSSDGIRTIIESSREQIYWVFEVIEGANSARYQFSDMGRVYRIGRAQQKQPVDIPLNSDRVSRRHVQIKLYNDVLRLSDNNSSNGTFVYEEQQRLNDGEWHALKSGDVFWVSKNIKIRVERTTH
jgi:Mg-chelatase subunit ChlD